MQSADGMFKKAGSKGEARAVAVTLVTAIAHSRRFTTCWALFSVFIQTDSFSPRPRGPAAPRERTRAHVARARSVIGVRGLLPTARGPAKCSADTHRRDRGAGYGGPGAQVPVAAE